MCTSWGPVSSLIFLLTPFLFYTFGNTKMKYILNKDQWGIRVLAPPPPLYDVFSHLVGNNLILSLTQLEYVRTNIHDWMVFLLAVYSQNNWTAFGIRLHCAGLHTLPPQKGCLGQDENESCTEFFVPSLHVSEKLSLAQLVRERWAVAPSELKTPQRFETVLCS